MHGEVPAEWAGRRVEASINLAFTNSPGFQAEGLLWGERPEGSGTWVPLRGLHPFNHDVAVADPAVGGEAVSYLVEAAANPNLTAHRPDPNSDLLTAGTSPIYSLTRAELMAWSRSTWSSCARTSAPSHELMGQLPLDQPRRHEILRALERMLDVLVLDDVAGVGGRGPGRAGRGAGPDRRCRRRTASRRSATPTSTRRGCGRSARRSASAPARSRTCWR